MTQATDFIRRFGLELAKNQIDYAARSGKGLNETGRELKRLVESHELVEKAGGLDRAIRLCCLSESADCNKFHRALSEAIADVEACQ